MHSRPAATPNRIPSDWSSSSWPAAGHQAKKHFTGHKSVRDKSKTCKWTKLLTSASRLVGLATNAGWPTTTYLEAILFEFGCVLCSFFYGWYILTLYSITAPSLAIGSIWEKSLYKPWWCGETVLRDGTLMTNLMTWVNGPTPASVCACMRSE